MLEDEGPAYRCEAMKARAGKTRYAECERAEEPMLNDEDERTAVRVAKSVVLAALAVVVILVAGKVLERGCVAHVEVTADQVER